MTLQPIFTLFLTFNKNAEFTKNESAKYSKEGFNSECVRNCNKNSLDVNNLQKKKKKKKKKSQS